MGKFGMFYLTVVSTCATISFVLPLIIPNVFQETATPVDGYGLGLFLGILLVIAWGLTAEEWLSEKS